MALKISILISSLTIGGAEKQTVSLINNINGLNISLISLASNKALIDEIEEKKVEDIKFLNKKYKGDIIYLIPKLRKILNEIKPDIVYCVNMYPLIYAYTLKKIYKQPFKIIVSLHTTILRRKEIFLFKWTYKPILNRVNHIIFVSRNQQEYWYHKYGIKNYNYSIIHNGIDLDKFTKYNLSKEQQSALRKEIGIKKDELLLCMCTALRPEKNHLLAISALKKVIEKNIPAKLLIIGDGPMRRRIENAIYQYKLKNKVIMLGSKKDIKPYVKISDIFLLTSSSETFSIAVLEAMALGKPIIAPNIGGLSEQVFHGRNGFLYKCNDENELVRYIIKIYNDNLINLMGEKSREIVRQFSSKQMAIKYKRIFENVYSSVRLV